MEKVAKHDWGGDRKSLTMLYTTLVRSKIDYASFLYSSAAKTHLEKLDRIQYRAIRIIIGNMKCTLSDNLEIEANIMPLKYRREQLALQYFGKACRISDHIIKGLYDDSFEYDFFVDRPHSIPLVGRCKRILQRAHIPFDKLETFKLENLHYENVAHVKYSLLKNKKHYSEKEFQHD